MNHTKGKWIALKNHQYCENGVIENYYEPDEDDINSPYVKIVNDRGETIVTNHDLFTFRNKDDAKLIALVPEMVEFINKVKALLNEEAGIDLIRCEVEMMVEKIKM